MTPPSKFHRVLSLQTLGEIDRGKVAIAFNLALRRVLDDIRDRPADDKARKACLEVVMKPRLDKDTGATDGVDVLIEIKDTVPKRKTVSYPMIECGDGVAFRPDAPGDPGASLLFDEINDDAAEAATE